MSSPSFRSHYTIPDQNSARAAARLAEQYRAQLDSDRSRQQRNRIIDVRPNSVAIERESSAATSRTQPAKNTTKSQAASRSTGEASNAPARQPRGTHATAGESAAYAYEPRTKEAGVALKSSPQARGVFVDLMA